MSGGQDLSSWRCDDHGENFFEGESCPHCIKESHLRFTVAEQYGEGKTIQEIAQNLDQTEKEVEEKLRKFIRRMMKTLKGFRKGSGEQSNAHSRSQSQNRGCRW
jgi:hypothetical protein